MKPQIDQIQSAAMNLAHYLTVWGDESDPALVLAQAKLIHDRAQELVGKPEGVHA